MRRTCLLIEFVCCILILLQGCSEHRLSDEEKKALAAFQAVQQSLETDKASVTFNQLLVHAEAQLTLIKQSSNTFPCLVSALDKCLSSYQIINKAMKTKSAALDEKRIQDLEMVLTFSTAFSALNIKQATDCCKQ